MRLAKEHTMAVTRGNGQNGGHFYSNITQPVELDLNFIVDSSNGNGLGIRSLKSNGYVQNVFMHTSATAGSNNGQTNPNPVVGYAVIQLNNNYNVYAGGSTGFVSTVDGSAVKIDNSAMTIGAVYVITTLGNSTAAQWAQIGIPAGVTPAVGVSFVAKAVGITGEANTSTSRVILPKPSGILSVEVIGDTKLTNNANPAVNGGMQLIVSFLAPTLSSTTIHNNPMIPTAPVDGSVVCMRILLDASSVTIDGL